MSSVFKQAFQAQALFQNILLTLPNVVGVAIGYKQSKGVMTDEAAVVVLVETKKPAAALSAAQTIPRDLNGMPTDVYEVGQIRALVTPRDRFRPVIPGGVSVGHYKVTAGTLGIIVTDRSTGEKLILSNNHVLANSNEALIGDPILQPGAIDGGLNPADMVARLERFIPLLYLEDPVPVTPTPSPSPSPSPSPTPTPTPGKSGCDVVDVFVSILNAIASIIGSTRRVQSVQAHTAGTTGTAAQATAAAPENRVDCAVAKIINPAMFSSEIRNIGQVTGTKPPTLGMRVRKNGRTTDFTQGSITLLNATVNVAYSTSKGTRTGRFTGQVITEGMSQGGDSGSLIVDATENKAVGLLFAGSNVATIFTPIDRVLDVLNVSL